MDGFPRKPGRDRACELTTPCKTHESGKIQANYTGNGMKSMKLSIEASLRRLQTSYIDLYLRALVGLHRIDQKVRVSVVTRPERNSPIQTRHSALSTGFHSA